jgi:hypothetical protein
MDYVSLCSLWFRNPIRLNVGFYFEPHRPTRKSRNSSVNIANGWTAGVRFPVKIFLYSTSSRPALGPTQSPTQCVPEVHSAGVKRSGREADRQPPAEVKKTWICTSTHPYAFMA